VHWAIVGGESGRSAREFSVDAARDIVRQCQAAGVPVHVKQMGARPMETDVDGLPRKVVYIATAGRDAAEWPEDLRVQEFPKV
jgi:protein gp37